MLFLWALLELMSFTSFLARADRSNPRLLFIVWEVKVQSIYSFVLFYFFLLLKKMSFHLILVPCRIMFQGTVFPHINLLISEDRWRMKWFSINLVRQIFPHMSRIAINEGFNFACTIHILFWNCFISNNEKKFIHNCSDWCTKMYVWMNDPLDTTLGSSYHRYMALKPVTKPPSRCISYDQQGTLTL